MSNQVHFISTRLTIIEKKYSALCRKIEMLLKRIEKLENENQMLKTQRPQRTCRNTMKMITMSDLEEGDSGSEEDCESEEEFETDSDDRNFIATPNAVDDFYFQSDESFNVTPNSSFPTTQQSSQKINDDIDILSADISDETKENFANKQ